MGKKMEHDETGCQAPPEGPILCVNNCSCFGSTATMNMCSKCHKDMLMKQEQVKLAATSIGNIENGSSSGKISETAAVAPVDIPLDMVVEPIILSGQLPSGATEPGESLKSNPKEGPNRCTTCRKRVGLTGFNCRCGNLFCGMHRYSDKHNCLFDYRMVARDAIAKANPVIKAEKLNKI